MKKSINCGKGGNGVTVNEEYFLPTREIVIENTTCCGAECLICPRESYQLPLRHMGMNLFKEVVEQAVGLGLASLDVSGFGDAFMDPLFESKLAYVKLKYPNIKIYTSTTCHLLSEKNIKMVCEYIDTLKISMYGLTKDVYEKVHSGSLKYEQVLNNIDSLLSIPRNKRPYIIMLLTVVPENEHQIEEWKNYWEPKVDEIMIWLPHNFGVGRDYVNMKELKRQGLKPKTCGRPFKGNYFVRANGEVSVCCFDYNHQLIIGDLKRSTLKEILLGEALQKIQRVHKEKPIEQSDYICKNCEQIYPREHALLYSNNSSRNAGVITSHSDLINILTSD